MQSSLAVSSLGRPFSPVLKHRCDYPSPPSSGRIEHEEAERKCIAQGNSSNGLIQVDLSKADTIVDDSARLPSISGRELAKEEDIYEDESDAEGEMTITDMNRSSSNSSYNISSPSTSIATHSHLTRQQLDGSPYIEQQLSIEPIRDTPRNPFLQGGPADVGHSGPNNKAVKKLQSKMLPRERGKMTYVFRGQRVTYADPYTSDSEEDDDVGTSSSLMDRLQPKLLFPSLGKANSRSSTSTADLFKKSDPMPSLDMVVDRKRACYKGAKSVSSHPLVDRINRAGWSDDDDDGDDNDEDHHNIVSKDAIPQRYVDVEEEDDDDDDDMIAEDDNPFLASSGNQNSASFLHKLQQAQVTTSSHFQSTRSGVIRSSHAGNRFIPYSRSNTTTITAHAYR